jgi:hypothetical protein
MDTRDRNQKLEVSSFPDDLRARFKAACALRRMTMSQVLVMLADEWTQQQEQQTERGTADAR